MPTHYVYDATKSTELCQGDILSRTPALVALLDEYFPYYSKHRDYMYFMVLTQTCDLVMRDGAPCNAPYISLAAVRPIKDIVLMEASKHQHEKLKETNVVGNKAREKLAMFLESLMDNNKAGLFYLHTDLDVGITEPCCAFLQLSVSFRSAHYDKCLAAKIAQLKEPFQAKLGWLIGNMYSRVATTEWNIERPAEKVGKVASKLLKQTIDNYDDEQIKVAIAELQSDGGIEAMAPGKIAEYVTKKVLVPKLKQFKDRAVETLTGMKVLEPVKLMAVEAMQNDGELKGAIASVIAGKGEAPPGDTADEVLRIVIGKIRQTLSDTASPEREGYISDLVSDLMADNVLKTFIK
jgi:hypothetical protein